MVTNFGITNDTFTVANEISVIVNKEALEKAVSTLEEIITAIQIAT